MSLAMNSTVTPVIFPTTTCSPRMTCSVRMTSLVMTIS